MSVMSGMLGGGEIVHTWSQQVCKYNYSAAITKFGIHVISPDEWKWCFLLILWYSIN